LPFSCDGKPEKFVADVKIEIDFLSQTKIIPNFDKCLTKLFEAINMTNVARGVWDLRDSKVMSTNAATAAAISNACKKIEDSFQPVTPKLPATSATYLPWTLDIAGYNSGKCEVTELARSFKEARGWASENSGWIKVHSIIELPDKITITYYDGLVKAESLRTFYKDMNTCKAFRQ
jgi:hypothetical protein